MIVKVVEANFSPGNHARMARPCGELGIGLFVGEGRLVRMNADAGPDFGVLGPGIVLLGSILFGEADAAVGGGGAISIADGEIGIYPGSLGALEDVVAVSVVARAFEMGVGIDEHGLHLAYPKGSLQRCAHFLVSCASKKFDEKYIGYTRGCIRSLCAGSSSANVP